MLETPSVHTEVQRIATNIWETTRNTPPRKRYWSIFTHKDPKEPPKISKKGGQLTEDEGKATKREFPPHWLSLGIGNTPKRKARGGQISHC